MKCVAQDPGNDAVQAGSDSSVAYSYGRSPISNPEVAPDSLPLETAPTQALRFINQQFDSTDNTNSIIQQLRRTPHWRYWFVASLIAVDVAVMSVSLMVSFLVKPLSLKTIENYIPAFYFGLIQCLIWLFSLLICGTYHRHVMSEGYGLYTKIFNAALLDMVITSCLVYMLHMNLPRTTAIIVPVIAGVLEVLARWMARRALHQYRQQGKCKYDAIIVGSQAGIDNMLNTLETSDASGYTPIAVCPIALDPNSPHGDVIATPYHQPDLDTNSQVKTIPNKGMQDCTHVHVVAFNSHFPRTAERLGAQIVIVTDVITRDNQIMHALSLAVESLGIELGVSISVADLSSHRIDLDYSGMQPILIASLPQYSSLTRFVKRTMDIIGSFIALIVFTPFIILPAAIAIKLEDHGPAFYKQIRIGRNGKPFHCYKLRSMFVNADRFDTQLAEVAGKKYGALFKVENDPRITKVGHFIRKYSIDEFPQFFNVLKGDMSLVGPRPQREYEVAEYGTLYSTRLLVRPGITGPWQVSGRSDLSQEEAERLDVSYIQQWSVTGDLAILAKTIMAVFRHTGSY